MNIYETIYCAGAALFYIGALAVFLSMEDRVTLLHFLACVFLFAPAVASLWPVMLLAVFFDVADNTTLWTRKY